MDPHVQPRCIALAKLGYVVLCVDAFGAGERAMEPGPGTYHGGLTGASLLPAGTPLIGLQVNDNRRAVDYLISRPEVDGGRLAITGASGGGNQTLYAGATDDRLKAVIPVCGIGTYDSYLKTACCVCEVNIGGAVYATTADLLAMVAPRALLVISAKSDALQFSVGEAAKSVARARERFRLLGHEAKIRHLAVDSGHDYNAPMREAMYGWVEKWLAGRGDGGPVKEPELQVEDIAALRCYPDGRSRQKTVVTIPEFAFSEGTQRLAALPKPPDHKERWDAESARMRAVLRDQILGGFPPPGPLQVESFRSQSGASFRITTEPGIRATGETILPPGPPVGTALIVAPRSTSPQTGDRIAKGAPAIVARDRAAGARFARDKGASILVMDDGHQNFSLRKNLSLVVVDAGSGFGNGRQIPAGPLREPVAQGLARADAVLFVGDGLPDLKGYGGPVLRAHLKPDGAAFAGKDVFAFAGIGRPEKFIASLEACGAHLTGSCFFDDHHAYAQDEITQLKIVAGDALLVTTEKDFVRLTTADREGIRVLKVAAEFDDRAAMEGLLDRALAPV